MPNDPFATPAQAGYPATHPQVGPGSSLPGLAHWAKRVLAYLVDGVIFALSYFFVIGPANFLVASFAETKPVYDPATGLFEAETTGTTPAWAIVVRVAAVLVFIAFQIYNRYYLGGKGQTIGKKALNISLINETTLRPIGCGNAFLRDIAHVLDSAACHIGYLWPLWDNKRQTFADKILGTVVVDGPPDLGRR